MPGSVLRVFWPLDLTSTTLSSGSGEPALLYGYAQPGRCGVPPALAVVGTLHPGTEATSQRRLQQLHGSPLVSQGESLLVLGEWRPRSSGAEGGGGFDAGDRATGSGRPTRWQRQPQQDRAGQQQKQQHQQHQQHQHQHHKQHQRQRQRQRQRHPWITAAGLAPLARTGQPMACPLPGRRAGGGDGLAAPDISARWAGAYGSSNAAAGVEEGHAEEADEGPKEVQLFLYLVPQPGRSHAPVLAAEATAVAGPAAPESAGEASCEHPGARLGPQPGGAWMGQSPGERGRGWPWGWMRDGQRLSREAPVAQVPGAPGPSVHTPLNCWLHH
jgi:hypothetical protein